MANIVVGKGTKVHYSQDGKYPICGSGHSSHTHNFSSPKARQVSQEITCEKCIDYMKVHYGMFLHRGRKAQEAPSTFYIAHLITGERLSESLSFKDTMQALRIAKLHLTQTGEDYLIWQLTVKRD